MLSDTDIKATVLEVFEGFFEESVVTVVVGDPCRPVDIPEGECGPHRVIYPAVHICLTSPINLEDRPYGDDEMRALALAAATDIKKLILDQFNPFIDPKEHNYVETSRKRLPMFSQAEIDERAPTPTSPAGQKGPADH